MLDAQSAQAIWGKQFSYNANCICCIAGSEDGDTPTLAVCTGSNIMTFNIRENPIRVSPTDMFNFKPRFCAGNRIYAGKIEA